MYDYEIKDGKGQHVFHGYESEAAVLQAISDWFGQLTQEAKSIQLIQFEYFDCGEIQATIFWGYNRRGSEVSQ